MSKLRHAVRFTPAALALAACAIVAALTPPASAQTLGQRLEHLREKQAQDEVQRQLELADSKTGQLGTTPVQLGRGGGLIDVPAHLAVEWIANATDVQIIVNWEALGAYGIDRQQPVTIVGNGLTGEAALDMLVAQLDVDGQLLWETTPWFVRILTKEQANQDAYVKVYPIGDLLMTVPNFTNAPQFDLVQVTQAPATGGGGGGGGGGIFDEAEDDEANMSMTERGEQIADLIRDTVEPDLWRVNGGTGGSVKYWQQHLIIRAPQYVHKQIAGEVHAPAAVGPQMRGLRMGPNVKEPKPDAQFFVSTTGSPAASAVTEVRPDRVFHHTRSDDPAGRILP